MKMQLRLCVLSILALLVTVNSWGAANVRHYVLTMHATSGTFSGQTYTGGFDVDISGLTGVGTETLPAQAMTNFKLLIFGNQYGPADHLASTVFTNGVLEKIVMVIAAPSATEGNQSRNVGFNAGFGVVPPELANGPWFGYLDTFAYIDGFGSYTLTLAPIIPTSYTLAAHAVYGSFAGQNYTGGFDIIPTGLTGIGTEQLGAGGITNFQINIFGNTVKNVPGITADLVDGRVTMIHTVFAAPSATEGNQNRNVGFNQGFGAPPPDLEGGPWFGYLDTFTYIDGFGSYSLAPVPRIRHFRMVIHLTSGTFSGQSYSGSFDIDTAALKGVGTESLPASAMSNFQLDMFGSHLGPLASTASSQFVDGRLTRIFTVVGVQSATEGNGNRNVGFNAGFGSAPPELVNGPWVGYLDTYSFVDGFGTYSLIEEFPTEIYTAVEVVFPSKIGSTYQVQSSPSLGNPTWTNEGAAIPGTGLSISQLFSTRASSVKYFRVQASP